MSAQLSPYDAGVALINGTFAGRVRAGDAVQASVELLRSGKLLCELGFTDGLREAICRASDVRATDDDTTQPCDGLSFGLAFYAPPAAKGAGGAPAPAAACDPVDAACP